MIGRFQFIWWGEWMGVFIRTWGERYHGIFWKSFVVGFFEIRVWSKKGMGALDLADRATRNMTEIESTAHRNAYRSFFK